MTMDLQTWPAAFGVLSAGFLPLPSVRTPAGLVGNRLRARLLRLHWGRRAPRSRTLNAAQEARQMRPKILVTGGWERRRKDR